MKKGKQGSAPARRSLSARDVDRFEDMQAKLRSLYDELQTLAKKNPNESVNAFKLRLVNGVLATVNEFLGSSERPVADFEQFDDVALPSHSDILMVLALYLGSLEKIRADNIQQSFVGPEWFWVIDGKVSSVQTSPPRKIE